MRSIARGFLLTAALASTSLLAVADDFPSKPIRLLVGFSAGGATDLITRALARGLTDVLGQPIIVENIAGGGGSLAIRREVEAAPDGYTLLMITSNEPVQSVLHPSYPRLERDLTPISEVAIGAYILSAHPSVKAKSVAELIAFAKANPGKLTYGSPGIGSGQFMAGELFKWMANVDILHVPYKGGGEVMTALVSGQIDMTFGALPPSLPFVKAGRIRALAVTTQTPVAGLPQVPTLNDAGLAGYDRAGWFALTGPRGMPPDLTGRLNAAVGKALNSQVVKDALAVQGLVPHPSTPAELAAFVHGELEQSSKLIEQAKVKAD
jgi:tripartite-type tricarboxylate transporter receptor subunit TctC